MCSHERDGPSDVQSLRGEVLPVLRKLLSVGCVWGGGVGWVWYVESVCVWYVHVVCECGVCVCVCV